MIFLRYRFLSLASHNSLSHSRRKLSKALRRNKYLAVKNEETMDFDIKRLSKRALASLKDIHMAADQASEQISTIIEDRKAQIIEELVKSGSMITTRDN